SQGFGASPAVQEGVKLGAMLGTSLFGAKGARKAASDMYNTARESLPEGASTSASSLNKTLSNVEQAVSRGELTAGKKRALEFIESVRDKINPFSKEIPHEEVAEYRRDINEMFYTSSNKAEAKAAQKYLRPLKESLTGIVKEAGKEYPQFSHNLLTADEIWS